jgi:hypothetical protein
VAVSRKDQALKEIQNGDILISKFEPSAKVTVLSNIGKGLLCYGQVTGRYFTKNVVFIPHYLLDQWLLSDEKTS